MGDAQLQRARGCLVGQIAGDSLGSLVEFEPASSIERRYPGGPRRLEDGGTWGTIAGQPTDDSEMALALARSLAAVGRFEEEAVARAYAQWCDSGPFDIGGTTSRALGPAAKALRAGGPVAPAARAAANRESQANGALMRVSPLGVFGWSVDAAELERWARADASLTHPHPVCQDASAVFVEAIAFAIRTGAGGGDVHAHALESAREGPVWERLKAAHSGPPREYESHQGWVLVAIQNAFYQLLHVRSFEAGVVDSVRRGGDTDTNAAIAGALLGAVHGVQAVPSQWLQAVVSCRPTGAVRRPRPREFWPVDVLDLADQLAAGPIS